MLSTDLTGTRAEDGDWIRLALGSLSSISQLSAELAGRSYGGGVLKLEPSEFTAWLVPLLPVEVAFSVTAEVETALLSRNPERASMIVDLAMCRVTKNLDEDAIQSVRAARDLLRCARKPGKSPLPAASGAITAYGPLPETEERHCHRADEVIYYTCPVGTPT